MKLAERARTENLWAKMQSYTCLQLSGVDHSDFLHRLSTQNLKIAKTGDVLPGAFLNANGTVVAVFHMSIKDLNVTLLLHPDFLDPARRFIEAFHFGEDLKCDVVKKAVWAFVGFGKHGLAVQEPKGFEVSETEMVALRAWMGVPTTRAEIGESNIILEAPFEDYVHDNKGCYPGQEVVERIRTYGNVSKKLMRVDLVGDSGSKVGLDLFHQSERVGTLLSQYNQDSCFGIASLKRLAVKPGMEYTVGESRAVAVLPSF